MESQIKNDLNSTSQIKNIHEILRDNLNALPLWYYFLNYNIISQKHILDITESCLNHDETISIFKRGFRWISHSLSKKHHDNVDILFFSRDRFIEVDGTSNSIKSDYLFYSTISEISIKFPNIKMKLLCTTKPPENMNIVAYNVHDCLHPFDLLKSTYFTVKNIFQWNLNKHKIYSMSKDDVQISLLFASNINSFFRGISLYLTSLIDCCYYNAIKNLNPKIIVSNDDLMQFKPKSNNSKLQFITLQSAIVSPINETYRRYFTKEFGSDKDKSDYFICPGEYYKELKEYSCVSKNVVVMGQPRYDILAHADKIYDQKKIMSDLGLDPTRKIILWCTQTHGQSTEENRSSISAIYNVISSLKDDVQLVIKLHPDEDQDAPLYNENTLYKPMILKRDMDTNALLYSCDLMITKNSTTAMEAIILNKPVIVLNLSGDPDRVNYVSEGVALGVYNQVDLFFAIKKLLDDNSILHEKREEYIKKYLYKIDGKATERVVDLIISLLDESKS